MIGTFDQIVVCQALLLSGLFKIYLRSLQVGTSVIFPMQTLEQAQSPWQTDIHAKSNFDSPILCQCASDPAEESGVRRLSSTTPVLEKAKSTGVVRYNNTLAFRLLA